MKAEVLLKLKRQGKKSCGQKEILVWILLLAVVICLIPLYIYGCYTVPLADDFNMSGPTYHIWLETKSIFQVVKEAWNQAYIRYMTWAGDYICMFLQSLPIGLGDYHWYFVSQWIILSIYVFAVYYAGKVFLVDYLHTSKKNWLIVSSVVFLYMTELLPDIYDAFYWYITAVSYTLSFAVKVIIVAMVFKEVYIREKISCVRTILILTLTFLSAGFECSFTHTCFFLVITAFFILSFFQKKKRIVSGLYWLVTTIGWGVALLAPGNMARQDSNYGKTTGVVSVIWESLHRGLNAISENMNLLLLLATLIVLPTIYKIVRESNREYRLPGLFTLYSIGIYASAYAPWVFSRGITAPNPYGGDSGYVGNVFWMTFVILWFANEIYWTGWIVKNLRFEIQVVGDSKCKKSRILYYGVLAMMLLFWSMNLEHVMEYTSPRLLWHLANGNAKTYASMMKEREELLKSNPEELLVVPEVEMPISTGGAGDITTDEENWVNRAVQSYYGLEYGVKIESK